MSEKIATAQVNLMNAGELRDRVGARMFIVSQTPRASKMTWVSRQLLQRMEVGIEMT
jgi:hypothetical protein